MALPVTKLIIAMLTGLRKLFRHPHDEPAPHDGPPPVVVAPAATPAAKPSTPKTEAPPPRESSSGPSKKSGTGMIRLTLKGILRRFPEELRSEVRTDIAHDAAIHLPASAISQQLAKGRVSVTLGQLKKLAPEGSFAGPSDQDSVLVDLPLQEIIPQLKGSGQTRRRQGENTGAFLKPSSPSGKSTPRPDTAQPGMTEAAKKPATQATSGPTSPAPSPAGGKSAASAPPPYSPPPTMEMFARRQKQGASARPTTLASNRPGGVSMTTRPDAIPTFNLEESDTTESSNDIMKVPLNELFPDWPEAVQEEVLKLPDPDAAEVNFPAGMIAPGIQRGKVVFPWRQVRGWIEPKIEASVSEHDSLELSISLKVLVPRFLAHKKPVAQKQSFSELEEIPDLFSPDGIRKAREKPTPSTTAAAGEPGAPDSSGSTTPAQETPNLKPGGLPDPSELAVPAKYEPKPVKAGGTSDSPRASLSAPGSPDRRGTETISGQQGIPLTLGRIFLQPDKSTWTIQEIVDKTSLLLGVSGALVATEDGLLVASQIPNGRNEETIAAFLPRLFSRVAETCGTMEIGTPRMIGMEIESGPVTAIKSGKSFLLVFGERGHSVPMEAIQAIAKHLD